MLCTIGALVLFVDACGGDLNTPGDHGPYPFTNVAPPPNGVAQFTVLPVSIAPGATLTALGSLNPPGHVLPTDHVYFYDWDLSGANSGAASDVRSVSMPATGAVIQVLADAGGEAKIVFRVSDDFYFYFGHVIPTIPLTVGQIIPVGTQIATTGPGVTVDLGAFDMSVAHSGFVDTARYGAQTLHVVSPWKYFTPALQAQIYQHVYRAPNAPDQDGKVDFGVVGKLVGDWYSSRDASQTAAGSRTVGRARSRSSTTITIRRRCASRSAAPWARRASGGSTRPRRVRRR